MDSPAAGWGTLTGEQGRGAGDRLRRAGQSTQESGSPLERLAFWEMVHQGPALRLIVISDKWALRWTKEKQRSPLRGYVSGHEGLFGAPRRWITEELNKEPALAHLLIVSLMESLAYPRAICIFTTIETSLNPDLEKQAPSTIEQCSCHDS